MAHSATAAHLVEEEEEDAAEAVCAARGGASMWARAGLASDRVSRGLVLKEE